MGNLRKTNDIMVHFVDKECTITWGYNNYIKAQLC